MPRIQFTVRRMMILVAVAAILLSVLAFSRRPSGYDKQLAAEYHKRGLHRLQFATLANGGFLEAVANLDQAIRLAPDFAEAYEDRGQAWRALGQRERARKDFAVAARLNPKLTNGFVGK